jgi:general secretion pathway protein A
MVAKLPDPGLVRNDFFLLVSHSFGIHHRVQDKETFTEAFDHFLERTYKREQKALLVVDEAQKMSPEILEEVRLLSNMECRSAKLLNIFLVGQNEFNQLLYKPESKAIRERITISYNLRLLTVAETESYIAHRMKIAGAETKIFLDDAVREIHAFSNGSPRLINIICDIALLFGLRKNATEIDSRMIVACKDRVCIPNVSGAPLPDEYLPARADSPKMAVICANSPSAGDGTTPHPPRNEALTIPAMPPKHSTRIRFHILLALLIFIPGSYLLYLGLNRDQSPEKLSTPKTIQAPAGQTTRQKTRSLAPLPQLPPSLSPGAVKTPSSEKAAAKEILTDGIVVRGPSPEAMQPQKEALPQGAEPPLADKKTDIATPPNSASPVAVEQPPEKPIQPTKSPATPASAPAPLQTEQMSKVNRPLPERKSPGPKKAPETLRVPSSKTPDPADIIHWLLQEKRKSGKRPNP